MDCSKPNPSDTEEFLLRFSRKVTRQRVPMNGTIELTRRCSFDCVHCYLGDRKQHLDASAAELDTAAWIRIIDEIAEAGCLFLLFTGGEPLLRQDFVDIYAHARKKGLLVTVFTNGYRVSDDVLEVFETYPPNVVEITLYGAGRQTYESITGRPDGFEECIKNIERLIRNGINIKLKTILMTKNLHEFDSIKKIAKDLGVKFRHDASISPCLNGDPRPLAYRVAPEEAAAKELSSKKRIAVWRDYAERMEQVPLSDAMYDCGAGANSFHIDPYGWLKPCLMVEDVKCSLVTGGFTDGWREVIPKIREQKMPADLECLNCESRFFCGFCPAFFRLETGSETKVSKYLCEMGHLIARAVKETDTTGEGIYV